MSAGVESEASRGLQSARTKVRGSLQQGGGSTTG